MTVEGVASICPNTCNGEFVNVSVNNVEKGQLQVSVLDATCRAVKTRFYSVESSLQTAFTFDSKLSPGLYVMELTNTGKVQTHLLVVQ